MSEINSGDVLYISLRGNKLPNDREIAQLVKGKGFKTTVVSFYGINRTVFVGLIIHVKAHYDQKFFLAYFLGLT